MIQIVVKNGHNEYVFGIPESKLPSSTIRVDNEFVRFIIDTGASVNIMASEVFDNFKKKPILQKTHVKIYGFGSDEPLKTRGVCKVTFHAENEVKCEDDVYIVDGNVGNILSWWSAEKLNLVKVTCNNNVMGIRDTDIPTNNATNFTDNDDGVQFIHSKKYPIFDGIGKFKGVEVKLHVDPTVKPTQQRHRRIPFHIRKDVDKELNRLMDLDIIENVEGPTPWVSPIVVVPNGNGSIRICVDMRQVNKAILRERHPIPTLDDIVSDLNGATVYSKLDLRSGYHQLHLHEDSRFLTTFTTHSGLYRYKRLIFGVNAASEIFSAEVGKLLYGLKGCKYISDDIVIFERNEQEHDENLKASLERLQQHGVTLNKEKCVFRTHEVKFYGHIFNSNGLAVDPRKVEDIQNAPRPTNASEVRSFLGLTQYVARFIPDYASLTTSLRKLTRKNVYFKWTDTQEQAFIKLKTALISPTVMTYFDIQKDSQVLVDASPTGLAAMLCQDGKVIGYASRSLTGVEQRYSQTEREMLAVVFGAEHFHLYLYGARFQIMTDHKPLLSIFNHNKPLSTQIERWRLRLMPYNYELEYRPGHDNPADYLSRHPNKTTQDTEEQQTVAHVNYIVHNAILKAMKLSDIEAESKVDSQLQKLKQAIEQNNHVLWNEAELREFKQLKDELTVFSREGYPEELVSDNGTQLTSQEFETFLQKRNIKHRFSAVYHPEGNSTVERFHRILNETIQTARIDKRPVKNAVTEFLGTYRATRHATTGESPSVVLHGRHMLTLLDIIGVTTSPKQMSSVEIDNRTKAKQAKSKEAYDKRKCVKTRVFSSGDIVRIKKPWNVRKGESKFTEPVEIRQHVGLNTYVMTNGQKWNVKHLAPFLGKPTLLGRGGDSRDDHSSDFIIFPTADDSMNNNSTQLGSRFSRSKRIVFIASLQGLNTIPCKKVVEGIKEIDDPLSDVELDSIVEGDSITEEKGEKEKGKTLSKQTRKSLRNRRMPKRYNEFMMN
ncbi:uncharacterized protein K02A2.6-like [Anneissia japonica]|uniref:uncharacterized protein K02A2.6-like n=1 Tax=Anneissia japonica TaxID=1529436 RepID=UPI0014258FF9|nr:uncharacterized protein K02A2.6-like [Anneissia japonica]